MNNTTNIFVDKTCAFKVLSDFGKTPKGFTGAIVDVRYSSHGATGFLVDINKTLVGLAYLDEDDCWVIYWNPPADYVVPRVYPLVHKQ